MKHIVTSIFFFLFIIGCAYKQPITTNSAAILIKTPTMKFYDTGFITKYQDRIEVQIYSAGTSILELKIYKDKICKDTFECQSLASFNEQYLHKSYDDDFLYKLFMKKSINYYDKIYNIKIKTIQK